MYDSFCTVRSSIKKKKLFWYKPDKHLGNWYCFLTFWQHTAITGEKKRASLLPVLACYYLLPMNKHRSFMWRETLVWCLHQFKFWPDDGAACKIQEVITSYSIQKWNIVNELGLVFAAAKWTNVYPLYRFNPGFKHTLYAGSTGTFHKMYLFSSAIE